MPVPLPSFTRCRSHAHARAEFGFKISCGLGAIADAQILMEHRDLAPRDLWCGVRRHVAQGEQCLSYGRIAVAKRVNFVVAVVSFGVDAGVGRQRGSKQ